MIDSKKNIKILSIESSGSICGVALTVDDKIIAEYCIFEGNLHDRILADLVNRILNDTGNSVEQLDAVAVSSGPGSFTGLRIGASIAKALCFDNKPKLIAVPTLSALAFHSCKYFGITKAKGIIAIMPSHKDMVYYQEFDLNANEKTEIYFEEFSSIFNINIEDYLISGPIKSIIDKGIIIDDLLNIKPGYISELALKMYHENKFTLAEDYVPLYVQDFQPKMKI